MAKQELEITIDPEGRVSIKVKGVAGKGCTELTKPLEDALGSDIESRTYTSDYYTGKQFENSVYKNKNR